MIDGSAMDNRSRTRGVVGNHASDGGAAAGGHVRRELEAAWRHVRIEFIKHEKKWWLVPLLAALSVSAGFIFLSGTAAAPFIYALF